MEHIAKWFTGSDKLMPVRSAGRAKRDKGFILITTMFLFAAISATVIAVLNAAHTTVMNTTLSREFIQAGQGTDAAIQDAAYQLNQAPTAPLPTITAPKSGTSNGGAWSWYAVNTGTVRTGPQLSIKATGTYSKTTRNATATAAALTVGSFSTNADGQLSYAVSPQSAFQHVLFGPDVTAQNGPGIGAASTWLTGAVGLTDATDPAKISAQPSLPSKSDVAFTFYGTAASTVPGYSGARRAPVGLHLDPKFAADNTSRCAAGGGAWVSSAHGGKLVANDNTGCYSSMVFDVPTLIEGTGAFNAFVSGSVEFDDNVSVPAGAALNIYANGDVNFNLNKPSLTISNTFIYAANGTCQTNSYSPINQSPFDPTKNRIAFGTGTSPLYFSGSLACDVIKVDGQFTTTPSINPLGDDAFSSSIWYLTDYRQPSGSRG